MNTYIIKAKRNGSTFEQVFDYEDAYLEKCEHLLSIGFMVYFEKYNQWCVKNSKGGLVFMKESF